MTAIGVENTGPTLDYVGSTTEKDWLDSYMEGGRSQAEKLAALIAANPNLLKEVRNCTDVPLLNHSLEIGTDQQVFIANMAKKRIACLMRIFDLNNKPTAETLMAISVKGMQTFRANTMDAPSKNLFLFFSAIYNWLMNSTVQNRGEAINDIWQARAHLPVAHEQRHFKNRTDDAITAPGSLHEYPALNRLGTQYEALPEEDRTFCGQVLNWKAVLNAIPNTDEFLASVASLSEPTVYWINPEGQFVVGEGCATPAEETLNLTHHDSQKEARRVANRHLITFEELRRKFSGKYQAQYRLWLANEQLGAKYACIEASNGELTWGLYGHDMKRNNIGAIYVVRIPLNLSHNLRPKN